MDSYNNDQESYNLICEATGCFDRATNKIIVKAGAQKFIFTFAVQRLRYQISGVYLDMTNMSNRPPEDIGPKCVGCPTQIAELKDVLIEVDDEGSFWYREREVSKVAIQRLKTELTIRRSGGRSF